MTREESVKAIKTGFVEVGGGILSFIFFAKLPFLNWWPLNAIIKAALDKALVEFADDQELRAFFYHIDVRGTAQGKDFEAAAHAYHAVKNKQGATPEEIKNAKDALRAKFHAFAVVTN